MIATATQETTMTPTTTTCINCHGTAPKFSKGLCQPCYNYQRRHGGARPVSSTTVDETTPPVDVTPTDTAPVEPPPVDPPVEGTPGDDVPVDDVLTDVPVDQAPPTDVPPPVTDDPHAAAVDAIMQLAAEGKGALLAKLQDGTLRWKVARTATQNGNKGGAPKGKLPDDQVRALRAERAAGASYGTLATKYNISPMGARAIALRETYKSVV